MEKISQKKENKKRKKKKLQRVEIILTFVKSTEEKNFLMND